MPPAAYTLDDLQRIDEECQAAARGLGLVVPEVVFHYAPAERIYDIAARGLPGRYAHWRFGRTYEREKHGYDHGASRIYELVLNTEPVQAYLLEGNSLVAQTLVIAHVYGHAACYRQPTRLIRPLTNHGYVARVSSTGRFTHFTAVQPGIAALKNGGHFR